MTARLTAEELAELRYLAAASSGCLSVHEVRTILAELAEVTRERDETMRALHDAVVVAFLKPNEEHKLHADALVEQHEIGHAAGFEEAREAALRACNAIDGENSTIAACIHVIRHQLKPAGGGTKL